MDIEEKKQELMDKQKEQQKKVEETRLILKQLISEGKLPEARSLTRGERRALDKAGVNIRKADYAQKRVDTIVDEMADWIIDHIYPEFDFDSVANNVCTLFAMYVYQMTYEDDLATKN